MNANPAGSIDGRENTGRWSGRREPPAATTDFIGQADLTVTVVRGVAGLESIRNAWEDVFAGMERRLFFHLWEWYYSYLKCLAPDPDALLFFLFKKDGTPVAVFPLELTEISLRGLKLKSLTFPSHDHLPLCDLICRREALDLPLFQVLIEALRNRRNNWDLIRLSHLMEDSCVLRMIRQRPPGRFVLRPDGCCDFMYTTESYESFLSDHSKKFRENLKRTKNLLGKLSGVEFMVACSGPELDMSFEAFVDVEASGWKGASGSGTAIKLCPRLSNFYQMLERTLCETGRVSIHTLNAEGKCIAAQFCIRLDETVYTLKMGYDEKYRRYAPGNLLRDFLIQRSIEDDSIRQINFVTDAAWHEEWKPESCDKVILDIFNTTPAGLVGFAALKVYPVLKKHYLTHIKHHLPGSIRDWIGRRFHGT
jgi:CelD/BcsL family acetyltransferase involved in cellulose biosynthesis